MNENNKKLADAIFKAVMTKIKESRKYNKEHNAADMWSRRSQQADISIYDNIGWSKGYKCVRDYSVEVEGKEIGKVRTHYDAREVFSELATLLNAQKKVKGWGGLNYMHERVQLASCSWDGYEVSIIPKVCFADASCKEWNSLMNYLNKYGNANIGNYQLFSAAMGGKRGVLWDEYGERVFIDNKPKKCARILEELRKNRGSKDKVICRKGEENYIDPEEQSYSSYHEVECEGEKRQYLEVTITTPQGKVKYTTKIY